MALYGKRERYDAAQEQVGSGRWVVDAEMGMIYGTRRGSALGTARDGYIRVSVPCTDGAYRYVSAHRVIWEHEKGVSDLGLTINHLNGDTTDNRISNLELISNAQNSLHGHRMLGRGNQSRNVGVANPQAKLDEEKVLWIRMKRKEGWTLTALAAEVRVGVPTVHAVVHGRTWRHV